MHIQSYKKCQTWDTIKKINEKFLEKILIVKRQKLWFCIQGFQKDKKLSK